jgi:predicted PurR-regulated permease PerM
MFVVLYFILYNYTHIFKPWLLILPSHGITNQHRAGYHYYEINKELKNVLRFIGVIAIIVSLSNVIVLALKGYNENIVLIGASVFITVVGFVPLLLLIICRLG